MSGFRVIQIGVFWHVTPCSLADRCHCIEGACLLGDFQTRGMNVEVGCFSEKVASKVHGVIFQKTEFWLSNLLLVYLATL
jgi:hypothetical protein